MATSARPNAAKLPISIPLADLTPKPDAGGGVPDRVPFVVPLLGLAVGVALTYVQPEKFTKTLSLALVVFEQSHAKVAVVVLVVPLPEMVREGKEVVAGPGRELVMEPEPETLGREDVALLEGGKGLFLVVRVVGRAVDGGGAAIVVDGWRMQDVWEAERAKGRIDWAGDGRRGVSKSDYRRKSRTETAMETMSEMCRALHCVGMREGERKRKKRWMGVWVWRKREDE